MSLKLRLSILGLLIVGPLDSAPKKEVAPINARLANLQVGKKSPTESPLSGTSGKSPTALSRSPGMLARQNTFNRNLFDSPKAGSDSSHATTITYAKHNFKHPRYAEIERCYHLDSLRDITTLLSTIYAADSKNPKPSSPDIFFKIYSATGPILRHRIGEIYYQRYFTLQLPSEEFNIDFSNTDEKTALMIIDARWKRAPLNINLDNVFQDNPVALEKSKGYISDLRPHILILSLANNNFDAIPEKFLNELSNLEFLNLSKNRLTCIPPQLPNLQNIHVLDLSNNRLSECGELLTFEGLFFLMALNLSGNQLIHLHPSIGQLETLISLDISKNELDRLPDEFQGLCSLQALILLGNKFTTLPACLTQLKGLKELGIGINDNLLTDATYRALNLINAIVLKVDDL